MDDLQVGSGDALDSQAVASEEEVVARGDLGAGFQHHIEVLGRILEPALGQFEVHVVQVLLLPVGGSLSGTCGRLRLRACRPPEDEGHLCLASSLAHGGRRTLFGDYGLLTGSPQPAVQ